jgi:putative hydrolase of the HAD superfamily
VVAVGEDGPVSFASGVSVVGVDGDDTLWRCEDHFVDAFHTLAGLLSEVADPDRLEAVLRRHEDDNLPIFGYGVKAFTLTALGVAHELYGDALPAKVSREILALGRSMLATPVELLPGAADAVAALATSHRLVLVTKGDLVDQRRKLFASGLARHFVHVEIVAEKDETAYAELLRMLDVDRSEFLMVGNSEVSDIVPVLALGSWAVHVPYPTTWIRERVEHLADHDRLARLTALTEVPDLLRG